MKPYAILPLVMSAVSFTVGFYEVLPWFRKRVHQYQLYFALICVFVGLYCVASTGLYNVDSSLQSVFWLRFQAVALNLASLTVLVFLSKTTNMIPRGVCWFLALWNLAAAAVHFLDLGTLLWNSSVPLHSSVVLPGSLAVDFYTVSAGPLTNLQYAVGTLMLVYFAWISFRYFKVSQKEARAYLGVIVVVTFAYLNDFLVSLGLYSSIYLLEYSWIVSVLIVALQRSKQLIEVSEARHALILSEERYKSIFESLQDVYFRCDENATVTLVSPSVESLFGVKTSELLGSSVFKIFTHPKELNTMFELLKTKGAVTDWEMSLRGPSGKRFDVSVNARMLDPNGPFHGIEGMVRNISERKQTQKEIWKALQEKELLLREVHHRVKNNLQIVSSLLFLQQSKIEIPTWKDLLQECRNQVYSIALIHEDLYKTDDLRSIDFGQYIGTLTERLLQGYGKEGKVEIVTQVEHIQLEIEQAIPCGLIVNELCTNALKYAFPDEAPRGPRQIVVEFRSLGSSRLQLAVSDTGRGLPKGFQFPSSESIGLQIVQKLTGQIGGTIVLENWDKPRFVIEFEALHSQSAGVFPPK